MPTILVDIFSRDSAFFRDCTTAGRRRTRLQLASLTPVSMVMVDSDSEFVLDLAALIEAGGRGDDLAQKVASRLVASCNHPSPPHRGLPASQLQSLAVQSSDAGGTRSLAPARPESCACSRSDGSAH